MRLRCRFYHPPSGRDLAGRDASVQSDLYALGLVMFEIIRGERLFSVKTFDELTRQQTSLDAAVPARLTARVRPKLRDAILCCLASDPSRRPASAQAVAAMLETVVLDALTPLQPSSGVRHGATLRPRYRAGL